MENVNRAIQVGQIGTVYVATELGLLELHGPDSLEYRQRIQQKENHADFVLFEAGKPVYFAIEMPFSDNGDKSIEEKKTELKPLPFPDPEDYGMTAPELYNIVVTYPETMAAYLIDQTKEKPSLLAQTKRVMAVVAPTCVIAFLCFLLAISLGS